MAQPSDSRLLAIVLSDDLSRADKLQAAHELLANLSLAECMPLFLYQARRACKGLGERAEGPSAPDSPRPAAACTLPTRRLTPVPALRLLACRPSFLPMTAAAPRCTLPPSRRFQRL